MTRASLKYAACAAAGYPDGSREHAIAGLAADGVLKHWPGPLYVVVAADGYTGHAHQEQKRMKRLREREEKEAFKTVRAATWDAAMANREAYGVVGVLGFLWLVANIASIVWPVIRWFFEKRYGTPAGDAEIQAVAGANH